MREIRPVKVQPIHSSSPESARIPIKIGRSNSFSWSLEPITKWMCLMGIPISINGSSSCQLSCCRLARIFCFLVVLSIHSSQTIHMLLNAKSIANSYITGTSSTALSWNFIIESFIIAVYAIGGHISLLLVTRSEIWMDLAHSFKLLEENLPSSDIYPACRKLAMKTIIYVISSALCIDLLLGIDMMWNESTLMRRILDLSSFFTKIYPITALGLFCSLAGLISLHLGVIRKRIGDLLNHCQHHEANFSLINQQRSQVKLLRRHHLLVCNLVGKLNCCFGFFLLVEVAFIFVTSINCFMYLFSSATRSDKIMGLLYSVNCLDCLVHLFLISSLSEDIISQTCKIQEALVELLHDQPSLQNEVNLFTDQLLLLKTHVHALGFFNVSKHLFPSLIGTTLTYFFILLQFHSAEK